MTDTGAATAPSGGTDGLSARSKGGRLRRIASAVCLIAACLSFFVGLLAYWAGTTVYDSDAFADRSVSMLDEPAVRAELASRLTEELAKAGNQNAVNFRPAFQLAVEAAVDTDTFRSIFRTAVRRTHQAVLASNQGDTSTALDLSDSVSLIVANLSLPSSAAQGQTSSGGLNNSLGDITTKLSDLGVWSWEDYAGSLFTFGVLGGVVLGGLAIFLSAHRRRTVRRLGWGVMAVGLILAGLVPLAQAVAGWRITDGSLSGAVSAGLGNVMADLRTMGLWIAAYGLILAAASRRGDLPLPTPARVWPRVKDWIDRRRASTGGTILVGISAFAVGAFVVGNASGFAVLAVIVAGLWISFLGVATLTRLVHYTPGDALASLPAPPGRRHRRLVMAGAVAVVAALILGTGAFLTTRQAARAAEAAGVPECNGEQSLCDVPVNLAMFAGSHNAMSSALYPGWLFAEQTGTLKGQLDAGVRALLIDTHYGAPSTARLPGSETTVVITDRAAELASPPGESYDPAIAARAQQVAANAPPQAGAERAIYLCHNFCEMGAVSFVDQMVVVRKWLEAHPEEVVILDIEDHTTPADTSADLEAAGLVDRAWTLDPTAPMPSMGDLVNAGRNLLVFAENAGPGSPDWYQSAYQWFQETPYAWSTVDAMTCGPNRGAAGNKFMLINHWVGYSPPDPGKAGSLVNSSDALTRRIEQCIDERGVWPNVVAVDFAERGDLMKVVARYNAEVEGRLGDLRGSDSGDQTATTPTTDGSGSATDSTLPASTSSGINTPTVVTSLTGGVPDQFCRAAAPLVQVVTGWALADLAKPAAAGGLPALVYGPAMERTIAAVEPSSPREITERLAAAKAQSSAAVAALRSAGLQQSDIDAMASGIIDQLAGANPDEAAAEQVATQIMNDRLGRAAVLALAQSFDSTNPTGAAVFDLGEVSDEVANASGYGCLVTG